MNQGRNDNGVEIEFILVSTEVVSYDSTIDSTRRDRGFDLGCIDSTPRRNAEVRFGFAHYWGQSPPSSMFSVPFAERRRVVIINGVRNARDLEYLEVLHNDTAQASGALSGSDEAMIKQAINMVQPGVTLPDTDGDGDPDETDPDDDNDGLWDGEEVLLGTDPLLADTNGNETPDGDEDPDGDHFTNLQELRLLLTNPLDGNSRFEPDYLLAGTEFSISFPTETGRSYVVERTRDLVHFDLVDTVSGTGMVESVLLGPPTGSQLYRVKVESAE